MEDEEEENEVWKVIAERCRKLRYVFNSNNLEEKRFKILDELLEGQLPTAKAGGYAPTGSGSVKYKMQIEEEENMQQLSPEGEIEEEELSCVDLQDRWWLLLAVVMMLVAMVLLMLDVGGM